MNAPRAVYYALAGCLLVLPFGLRLLTGPAPRTHRLDPAMVREGRTLFSHEWTANDPLTGGDGLGPVYNATSCAACHHQNGVGGSGGLEHNVTMFVRQDPTGRGPRREGVVHAFAVKHQETMRDVDPSLPAIARPTLAMLLPAGDKRAAGVHHHRALAALPDGLHLSQRNTPALFGAKLLDEIPDAAILANERAQRVRWAGAPHDGEISPVGRAARLAGGRVGRFGWKGQSASLSDFVRAACAGELGLGNPGQDQPAPLGAPDYRAPGMDLTAAQCDQLTTFVAALPRPVERAPADPHHAAAAARGGALFGTIGCAECHTPTVGSVVGVYSDLLLHRMGQDLEGGGSYNQPPPSLPEASPGDTPLPDEWRTPPLWGVADSAPYLHDGRAATLEDAIRLHAGQATRAATSFHRLSAAAQADVLAFLQSLRAP